MWSNRSPRSEVVGRPLAALLANDGARVFSVDIDSIQEYTKRPHVTPPPTEPSSLGEPSSQEAAVAVKARRYHPPHVVHPSSFTLQECLALSDVVISAVPSPNYKVKTEWLKDGCLCLNVAAHKNFEKDVREKVDRSSAIGIIVLTFCWQASLYLPACGKVTIFMLLRNLWVNSTSYFLLTRI